VKVISCAGAFDLKIAAHGTGVRAVHQLNSEIIAIVRMKSKAINVQMTRIRELGSAGV
jgi:hypothetical protein